MSIFNKFNDIKSILDLSYLRVFDIISTNESKLDENIPSKLLEHNFYNIIRRDDNRLGGGIIVFDRKAYVVIGQLVDLNCELFSFQLKLHKKKSLNL